MIQSDTSIRVYYEDTDAGGVVYYANYLKYLERGRTDLLREWGFEQEKLMAENIVFVVRHVNINYHHPARLDNLLSVQTAVAKHKKASIIFSQKIIRDNVQIVDAEVTVACLQLDSFRVTAIPENIQKIMQD